MPTLPSWPYPRLCAHRGAGERAPENTLAALRLGYEFGYRMAEFDVKLSADGIAFLLHDDTLDRTTDGRGPASALSWSALALLDAGSWLSPPYAGEPPASLAAVARFCRANEIAANIEIKPSPGDDRETGARVAADAAHLWAGAEVRPLLSSYSEVALTAARIAIPALPRAWLTDTLPSDWREQCARLGCVALDVDHAVLTREIVVAAHAAGLRVVTFTVNDLARAAELAAWGVDTIITDAVDTIVPDAFPPA